MRRRRRATPDGEPAADGRLLPLAGQSGGRGSLNYLEKEGVYLFEAAPVRYRVAVGPEAEAAGLLRIEGQLGEGPWQPLLTTAGPLYRARGGEVLPFERAADLRKPAEFRHQARGLIVTLRHGETLEGQALRRTCTVRLLGRSLGIHVASSGTAATGNYCGFSLGPLGPEETREVRIPYAPEPLRILPQGGFLAGYVDPWQSSATEAAGTEALYLPRGDRKILPLEETFYLTLSDDPLAPLPQPQRDSHPHRAALAERLWLDVCSELPYAEERRLLEQLRVCGMVDVALVYRCWQQFGYNRRPPCFYPADPTRGRNEEFRRLVAEASEAGWLVALREDYSAITADSPYWDPKVAARDGAGRPRPSRGNGFAIAADKMLEFARLEATKIQRNYRVNAAFVESHSAWRPEEGLHQLDADPGNDRAARQRDGLAAAEGIIRFLGSVHEGPVLGAGGRGPERFDTLAPQLVDGAERPLEDGCRAPVIPDYELLVVRPNLVGYGLGDPAEFFPAEAGEDGWDCYRATAIAFGHGGALWGIRADDRWLPNGSLERGVSEYFLLRALQEQYLTAPVRAIGYREGDRFLTLAEALRREFDFTQAQLKIDYGNGLTVWVNRHARDTWSVTTGNTPYLLPPGGWLAANSRTHFLAYSALVAGSRADACLAADYQFVNPRGETARRVEGITADGVTALLRNSVAARRDMLLINGRTLEAEPDTLRLSERATVRLIHRSAREIEIHVLDTENGKPVHVTFTPYSGPWRGARIEVEDWFEGAWRPSQNQVQQTKQGPQLDRAFPGQRYRLTAAG